MAFKYQLLTNSTHFKILMECFYRLDSYEFLDESYEIIENLADKLSISAEDVAQAWQELSEFEQPRIN